MDQQNRKKTFPESAVWAIARDGLVRATAKTITAGLNDIILFSYGESVRLHGNRTDCRKGILRYCDFYPQNGQRRQEVLTGGSSYAKQFIPTGAEVHTRTSA
mgnify:CR=1 FL=1